LRVNGYCMAQVDFVTGIDDARDGGRHWDRLQPHGLEAGNMSPVSAREARAVGCVQQADNCDVLLHTRDTGRTWQVVHPAPRTPVASVAHTSGSLLHRP
jgi:photosystem II stability/assembly factor-like uncharacterized protein